MIKSVVKGFAGIARKPAVLLPAVIAGIIQLIIAFFAIGYFLDINAILLYFEGIPEGSLLEMLFLFYQTFTLQVWALIIAGIIAVFLQAWVLISLARIAGKMQAGEKASVFEAMRFALSKFWVIASIIIFGFVVAVLAFSLLVLISFLFDFNALAGMVIAIVAGIIAVYLLVRLFLFAAVIGAEDANLKESLATSWHATFKRFWATFIFIIILVLINSAIEGIAIAVNEGIASDDLAVLITAVFSIIALTYSGLAIGFYYAERRGSETVKKGIARVRTTK